MLHDEVTGKIIGAYFNVYNALGFGFLEKVYENALKFKLEQIRFVVLQQVPIKVYFEGQCVGNYVADLLVNDLVSVELKTVETVLPIHEAQLINYLKATEIEVGLLLNFGPKAKVVRRILTNDRKPSSSQNIPNQSRKNPRKSS
jgi:GxxExxY protein